MDFKIQYANGKVEEWDEHIFLDAHRTSYPSGKRTTKNDRIMFRKMLLEGNETAKEGKKVYSIDLDNENAPELVDVVKAYLKNERTIKQLIVIFAEHATFGKDDLLNNSKYEYENENLSIDLFEAPFRLVSNKLYANQGFDEIEGEFVKWAWIKTLRRKSVIRYRKIVDEIFNYYTCPC